MNTEWDLEYNTKTTTNNVNVVFNYNLLTLRQDAPPFLSFDDDGNLTEINFEGYEIKPRTDYQ